MAFADHIVRSGRSFVYYVRVGGVPALFLTRSVSDWVSSGVIAWGGEDYTPSVTLAPPAEWAEREDAIDAWSALAEAGQLSIPLLLRPTRDADPTLDGTDPVHGLVATSRRRGWVTGLASTASLTATSLVLDTVTGAPSPGDPVYVGTETVTHVGTSAGTTLTGVTRGRWGSVARYHSADVDATYETGIGGPYVADHALVLGGRIVEVYIALGRQSDDGRSWRPYGSAPGSDEDLLVWRGFVRGVDVDAPQGRVILACEGLRSVLAERVATRLPRLQLGVDPDVSPRMLYIGAETSRLGWAWWPHDFLLVEAIYDSVTLQRDGGGGSTENVPAGWYTATAVGQYVAWTILSGDDPGGTAIVCPVSTLTGHIYVETDSGGERRWHVALYTDDLANAAYDFELRGAGSAATGSLWRMLGFEGPEQIRYEFDATERAYWRLAAQRRAALLYMPAGWGTHEVIYRSAGGGADLDFETPGWASEGGSGDDVASYLRIDEECITISGTTGLGAGRFALTIASRGELGSRRVEHYVEEGDEEDEALVAVQGVVFPRMTWAHALLTLATSVAGNGDNGAHDLAWRGAGAAIPSAWIDSASWLRLGDDEDAVRTIVCFEPIALDELIGRVLALTEVDIVERAGLLTAVSLAPPLEHELLENATTLDETRLLLSRGDLAWELDEAAPIGFIEAGNLGYDHGAEEERETVTWSSARTRGTYPEARGLRLDMQDYGTRVSARRAVRTAGARALAQWSAPPLSLRVGVGFPEVAWVELQLGGEVYVTHSVILSHTSVTRGAVALPGRIYGLRRSYRGASSSKPRRRARANRADTAQPKAAGVARILVDGTPRRRGGYGPSGRVLELVTSTQYRLRDHHDSYDTSVAAEIDASYFPVDSVLWCYNPGNESGGVERTVTARTMPGGTDQGTVTLNSAPGLPLPIIIESTSYDSAIASHQRYAYLSDGDGVLGAGSDEAYYFL